MNERYDEESDQRMKGDNEKREREGDIHILLPYIFSSSEF